MKTVSAQIMYKVSHSNNEYVVPITIKYTNDPYYEYIEIHISKDSCNVENISGYEGFPFYDYVKSRRVQIFGHQ